MSKIRLLIAFSVSAAVVVTAIPAQVWAQAAPGTAPANGATLPSQTARRWVDNEYRLGPGDKLRVEVYREPQLSQSLQIRPDGKITLPLIGDVEAQGRTALELRDQLGAELKEYVTNPVVTVIVTDALAATAFVIGEVSKPGAIPMNGPLTVLQALAVAGGFKEFADKDDIKILRRTSSGVETIRFNYNNAIKAKGTPMYLQPGDTIVVP